MYLSVRGEFGNLKERRVWLGNEQRLERFSRPRDPTSWQRLGRVSDARHGPVAPLPHTPAEQNSAQPHDSAFPSGRCPPSAPHADPTPGPNGRRLLSRAAPAPRAAGGSQAESCPAAPQREGSAGFAPVYSPEGGPAAGARARAISPAGRPVPTALLAGLPRGGRPRPRRSPWVAAGERAGRPRPAQVPQGPSPPRHRRRGRAPRAAAGGGRAAPIAGETSPPSARAGPRCGQRERSAGCPPKPLHLPASGPLRDRPRGEGKAR